MTSKTEGRRERFQKWVLATKHPVLGFLDGHWLARGDDREGYASEYVQGLWVAFKEFAAPEAPRQEPVAWGDLDVDTCDEDRMLITDKEAAEVYDRQCYKLTPLYAAPLSPDHSGGGAGMVLPERAEKDGGFFSTQLKVNGWNACLDKFKELNQ